MPLTPTEVSGVSYPVSVEVCGSTKFYDYKSAEDMDLSALIDENISTIVQNLVNSMSDTEQTVNITIDDIFPLKSMLYKDAVKNGNAYTHEGTTYVNIPVAYYGGGLNLSTVSMENMDDAETLDDEMSVEWVDSYLSRQTSTSDLIDYMQSAMQKTVTVVTGVEPFRFVCTKGNGYLYKQTPSVSELRENTKR